MILCCVSISLYSGMYGISWRCFWLQVARHGHGQVELTVPRSFQNRVCGLCGNFNDNSLDDFSTNSRHIMRSIPHFVKRWQVYKCHTLLINDIGML